MGWWEIFIQALAQAWRFFWHSRECRLHLVLFETYWEDQRVSKTIGSLPFDDTRGGATRSWDIEGGTILGEGSPVEEGTTLEKWTIVGGSMDARGGWSLDIE